MTGEDRGWNRQPLWSTMGASEESDGGKGGREMPTTLVLHGTVTADGKLELEGNPVLPMGHVKVTVETEELAGKDAARGPTREDLLTFLDRIRTRREARGARSRTREEIDADLAAMRAEWDEREAALDACHEHGHGPRGEV